jgi:putative intracellular protease/amidase
MYFWGKTEGRSQSMGKNHLSNGGPKVAILIAPSFEEGTVVYCLDRLRDAGLSVLLISSSAGLINGLHGLSIRPDLTLDQINHTMNFHLAIVPGSRQCTTSLLADPRVHELFDATWQNGGCVVAAGTAAPVLAQARVGAAYPSQYITQGDMSLPMFADHLINLVLS